MDYLKILGGKQMSKEFHIICSGVSIIKNAQKEEKIPANVKISDESYWRSLLDNPTEIEKIKQFVEEDPYKNSAELNTFLRVVEGKAPENIEVYLFGTNTSSNELCRRVIEAILKSRNYRLYTPHDFSGYFWEASMYDVKYAIDEFKRGISDLLDKLIYLALRKKEEGYKVYFNPTAGFKSHVIATAIAANLVNAEAYYMNEEFNEIVFLPKLFYLPKGREIELLKILGSKGRVEGPEMEKIMESYKDEIERLLIYGMIEKETKELGEEHKLQITNKGRLFLAELSDNL